MPPSDTVLLTVREAAERLRLSPAAIYEMIRRGSLAAVRVGPRQGAIRIRAGDLEACMQPSEPLPSITIAKRRPQKVKLRHIRI